MFRALLLSVLLHGMLLAWLAAGWSPLLPPAPPLTIQWQPQASVLVAAPSPLPPSPAVLPRAGRVAPATVTPPLAGTVAGSPAAARPAPDAALAQAVPAGVSPLSAPGPAVAKAGLTRPVQVRMADKPSYPPLSRELGEEGMVLLRLQVDAEGRIVEVKVLQSSGSARLDRAARDSSAGWLLAPAWQDGEPVAAMLDVPVYFRLNAQ